MAAHLPRARAAFNAARDRAILPYLPLECLMRTAALLLATACAFATPAGAQNQPPHSWLFGTWTGGYFPVPSSISAEACLAQPVVIFTRDLVMRATLVTPILAQREIESVRATPQGAEFRFASSAPIASPLLGIGGPTAAGFGCTTPDGLTVQRRSENEILFPGCTDFPNPLVRCPGR